MFRSKGKEFRKRVTNGEFDNSTEYDEIDAPLSPTIATTKTAEFVPSPFTGTPPNVSSNSVSSIAIPPTKINKKLKDFDGVQKWLKTW